MDNNEINSNSEQIILSIISLMTVLVSIILLFNERYKLIYHKGFINTKNQHNINIYNRTILVIVFFLFLIINYNDYKNILKKGTENPEPYLLQVYSSLLVVIATSLSLYVVLSTKPALEADLENPSV